MELEITHASTFTQDEVDLIEKARHVLRNINQEYRGVSPEGHPYHYVAGALIYTPSSPGHPIRIDFKSYQPGQIGQAFIGPLEDLVPNLFEGDGFAPKFLKEFQDSMKYFGEYLKQPLN